MKRTSGVAVFAVLICFQLSGAEPFEVEPGFVRLDNGEDLQGWGGATEGWSVINGAIYLNAERARGSIYSEKTHSANAVIRLEFRATPRADSGVFIHGNQLQVRDYPTAGPRHYAPAAKPAGEWNQLEFDITDGIAVVKLNGQVIEQAWKIGTNPKKGIGLQKERGNFEFRYIRVKEEK
jgi:hypothetical protein